MRRIEAKYKALVLKAFDAAFNKRDLVTRMIATGHRELKYKHGVIVAERDFVIVHARFSDFQKTAWITADIVRIGDGLLVEHWDVIQDEATRESSKSGLLTFTGRFGEE